MDLTEKRSEKFKRKGKKLLEEERRTKEERVDQILQTLAQLAVKVFIGEQGKQRRLKDEPEGFPVDGQCIICSEYFTEETGWYSMFGKTCLCCLEALKKGILPLFVCKARASFYITYDLKSEFKFNLTRAQIQKHIKNGLLTARTVFKLDGNVHCLVFLKKENPALKEYFNPIRKSYYRNRQKINKEYIRTKFKKQKPPKRIVR